MVVSCRNRCTGSHCLSTRTSCTKHLTLLFFNTNCILNRNRTVYTKNLSRISRSILIRCYNRSHGWNNRSSVSTTISAVATVTAVSSITRGYRLYGIDRNHRVLRNYRVNWLSVPKLYSESNLIIPLTVNLITTYIVLDSAPLVGNICSHPVRTSYLSIDIAN